jgi:RNA recognition motif-containing protein
LAVLTVKFRTCLLSDSFILIHNLLKMNIFVSNLSFNVNDADLRILFEEFGQVTSAKVIMDKMSGKSRGFGFVEMDDDAKGQVAIKELNQCEYDNRVIMVNVAKPRTENSDNRFPNRGGNNNYNSRRQNSRY